MELTDSWREVFPLSVLERYEFAETRNAAAILNATSPGAFDDLVAVLEAFELDFDKLSTPGGRKSVIAEELDERFRVRGWREARFEQELTTRLLMKPWSGASERESPMVRETPPNQYGGHLVDNVKDRAVVDVEWNPKDGNLDRDLSNYVALYDSGMIDAGVLLTRSGDPFGEYAREVVERVREVPVDETHTVWHRRMRKLSNDLYKTSTTANFGKLEPRIRRGDGRGCPILGIGITFNAYRESADLIWEVQELAARLQESATENQR